MAVRVGRQTTEGIIGTVSSLFRASGAASGSAVQTAIGRALPTRVAAATIVTAPPPKPRTVEDVIRQDGFVPKAGDPIVIRPQNGGPGTNDPFSAGGPPVVDYFPRNDPMANPTGTLGITASAGGRTVPVNPSDALSGLTGAATSLGCSWAKDPRVYAACVAAGGYLIDRITNRGESSGSSSDRTLSGQENCPDGYKKDANGVCRVDTATGGRLPGDIGRPDTVWNPVTGLYGIGVTPVLVQSAKRACPTGFVLGKDGICYESLPRGQRAHNPGARPLLTGGEMNAIRTAQRVQKKLGKAQRQFGKKTCNCSTRSRAKKK